MSGPLAGVKVIEVAAVVSAPYCGMLLADQGADVVKIEPPGVGEMGRLSVFNRGGVSALFVNLNRGKRSLALDVTTPAGREIVLDLVRGADVFL